jgi:hypothetical protein
MYMCVSILHRGHMYNKEQSLEGCCHLFFPEFVSQFPRYYLYVYLIKFKKLEKLHCFNDNCHVHGPIFVIQFMLYVD